MVQTDEMTDKLNALIHEHLMGKCMHEKVVRCKEYASECGEVFFTETETSPCKVIPDYANDDSVILGAIIEYGIRIEPEIVVGNGIVQKFVINGIKATKEDFRHAVMIAVLKKMGVEV